VVRELGPGAARDDASVRKKDCVIGDSKRVSQTVIRDQDTAPAIGVGTKQRREYPDVNRVTCCERFVAHEQRRIRDQRAKELEPPTLAT
jgi:hypothetical protein